MIGKYVIVRGDRSGVFAGTLAENDGRKVVLNNVRRLWRWCGATECLQLATEGVKKPKECRFTLTAETITLLDASFARVSSPSRMDVLSFHSSIIPSPAFLLRSRLHPSPPGSSP